MKNQRKYSKELKEEAIKMIFKDGLTNAEVSNRLGIPKGTIGGWIARAKAKEETPRTLAISFIGNRSLYDFMNAYLAETPWRSTLLLFLGFHAPFSHWLIPYVVSHSQLTGLFVIPVQTRQVLHWPLPWLPILRLFLSVFPIIHHP